MLPFLFQVFGVQPGLWNVSILSMSPQGPGIFRRDLTVGDGVSAKEGGRITIEFVASTLRGRELANTEKRGLPYIFPYKKTPDMWTRLVQGMHVNGTRLVMLTPEAAYGAKGVPGIVPPGEALLIWVKMTSAVAITSAPGADQGDQP